jgi:hypothetical protein
MKKKKEFILSIMLILIIGMIGVKKVNAESYTFDLIPYNVTSACNVTNTNTAKQCAQKALNGSLSSYQTNMIEAGDTVMVLVNLTTSADASVVYMNWKLNLETDKLTYNSKAYWRNNQDTIDDSDTGMIPSLDNGGDWSFSIPNQKDNLIAFTVNDNATENPMANVSGTLYALFFKISDSITSGTNTDITFDSITLSNEAMTELKSMATTNKLTLSVASNISKTGTLSALKATGSNNLDYPFNFVADDDTKLEYNVTVPNAVNNIVLSGTPTDSKVQGITGINRIDGIETFSAENPGSHDLTVGDNPINIVVTAESGDTTVYKITVKRLSNDTTIDSVTGTNSVSFTSINETSNSITVPYSTASSEITVTLKHGEAFLDAPIGTWTINSDGNTDTKNNYTILVSSEECKAEYATVPGNENCTKKSYPFEIIRKAPSKNVNLSALEVDGVAVPGFDPVNDPEKKDFTLADVTANKTSVNVTATVSDPLSTVKIGEDGNNTQNLKVGDNTIKVTVTGEDNVTKKEYTIHIKRLSNDNLLAETNGLTISSTPTGTLTPNFVNTFDSSMGNYTYTFPANVGDITVSATVKDTGKSSVSIIDMSNSEDIDTSSKTLNTASQTFSKTTTKVGVIVTAEDGSNRVYKIDFKRLTSSDSTLKSLTVTPGGLKETFAPTTSRYTAEVDPDVTSVTVNYETQDTNAKGTSLTADAGLTVSGNTVSGLQYGANTIVIRVTAEDNSFTDYTITVTRKMSSEAGLDQIRVGYDGATPTAIDGFNKATTTYNLSTTSSPLPYNTASINIEFDKSNSEATVTGDIGVIDLTSYSNKKLVTAGTNKFVYEYTFDINVDSQDHKAQETYTLKMYKEANNDVNTDAVTVHGVTATLDPSDATNSTYKVEVGNNITSVAWNNINVTTHETTSVATAITTGSVNLSTTADTTFDYLVTAENGETKTFHIIITRKKSTVNTITRVYLYLENETTSTRFCEYTGSNTSCTIEVPTGTSKYRLEAVLPDGATMTPESTTEYIMGPSAADSTQSRVLTINPEDETAPSKDYTVVVKRLQSSNNLLGTLETNANSETMVDILGSDKVSPNRSVTVPSSQTTVRIHAVAEDGTSRITSNKYTGAASSDITFDVTDLKYGTNLVTITVTSELNVPKIYNLTITREDNTEPRLSMITIDGNPINDYLTGITFDADPSKNVDDTNYTYNLNMFDNSVASITLGATSMDTENGSFTGTGKKDLETIYHGTTYDSGNIYTNTFVIRAYAHNKDIYKDYTINITRASNSDVELGANAVAINYDGSNHAATWNEADNRYEITVPNSVNVANSSNVIVTVPTLPGANDKKATVTMNETVLKTDDETTANVNTHKFTVTAEDGTEKEYTLEITRELSGNAFLKSISILDPNTNTDIGSWSPSFGDGITTYTVSVPVSTTDIKIDAEIGEAHQKIQDGDLKTVTLASSDETFTILVTAENGHQETYTLKVLREQSRINSLKSLKIKDTEGKEFVVNSHASQLNRFTVTIPGTVDKVVFEAVSDSALATINYLGVDAGTTDTYSLSTGTVTKEFTITSESGIEAKYYVEITKLPKTDATLKKLAYKFNISDSEIEIPLQDGIYEYTIPDEVANDIKTIIISGETTDSDATITSGNTTHNLNTGENTIEIHTQAEDPKETLTYKIKVNRAKNGNAYLKTLSVGTYTFDESIDFENTFNYAIHVDETKEKLLASEITAEAAETTSKVTLEDNDLNLVTGDNIYHITVKAENDHEEHYTITVKKPASTNATLKEVKITGGSLKETLSPTLDTYTIMVPFGTTSIDIEGIPTIDAATVDGNGNYNVVDTPITLTVHPEDTNASDKTYTFNIEVAASNIATLNTLSVTNHPFTDGTTEVTFESEKEGYSIGNILKDLDKLTINANATNPNATVSYHYNGSEITSCHNNASCEITLDSALGAKNVEVKVLAADNHTEKTYTIAYTKINSNNNKLSNILAFDKDGNSLSLSEIFNPEVKSYKVSIPNDLDSIRLDVTKDDQASTVTINEEEVLSKTFVSLPEGTTTVTIKVVAQDGSDNTYTVDIERAAYTASTDAELTDLKVMDVTDTTKEYPLTPTFGGALDDHYSIGDIPYNLTSLKIETTLSDSKANIKYYVNDVEQSGSTITLPNTGGTIKVEVTAEDNTTKKEYLITYTKTPSTNAYLSGITVNNGTLTPEFGKEVYEYTVDLTNDLDSIDIQVTTEHSGATITINGETYTAGDTKTFDNLQVGENTITIVVTAEDGSNETYVVKVNRADVVIDEKITSITFGHTIDDDYIRTVSDLTTAKDMKDQLDNDNSKLVIYKSDGTTEVTDTELVGTGCIVKLIIDGIEKDSKVIIIRGDVNGDGEVELFDAADIINHFLDTQPLEGVYLIAGDVNKDGETELFDAADIINHYLDTAPIQFKD